MMHTRRQLLADFGGTDGSPQDTSLLVSAVLEHSLNQERHSDQGAKFESSLIAEMLFVAGVQKSHTTPYHTMGNGAVKSLNCTLGNIIRALPPKAKHRWPRLLRTLTFTYNATARDHRFCAFSIDVWQDP